MTARRTALRIPRVARSRRGVHSRSLAALAFAMGVVMSVSVAGCTPSSSRKQAAPQQQCTTTTVVGLRGSGQPFLNAHSFDGSVVLQKFAQGFNSRVNRSNSGNLSSSNATSTDIKSVNINYPAAPVPTGLENSKALADYAASVETGASALVQTLLARASSCQHGELVVVGYSQGAWAARVGINRLAAQAETGNASAKRALMQIHGLALIGDPMRSATATPRKPGTAHGKGNGLALKLSLAFMLALAQENRKIPADLFSTSLPIPRREVRELCASGDAVCASVRVDNASLQSGIKIHRNAYTSAAKSQDGRHSLAAALGEQLGQQLGQRATAQ